VILKVEGKENLHSFFFKNSTRLTDSQQAFIENCTSKEKYVYLNVCGI